LSSAKGICSLGDYQAVTRFKETGSAKEIAWQLLNLCIPSHPTISLKLPETIFGKLRKNWYGML
jgi:hypothetical protein